MESIRCFLFISLFIISGCDRHMAGDQNKKDTLFTMMLPSYTGISFANNLTYTEEFNPYTYRNFYNGGGVGIGDINNDGLPDIFFCGNQVDSKLYLNKGNFEFEDITDLAGVACTGVWAAGVAFVDINGDGYQDLYVCKSGKPGGANRHNELFINQGNMTFIEKSVEYGLDNTGLSSHAAFFDYDRDGDLDCYLLNNSIRTVGAYDLRKDQRDIRDSLGGNKLLRNDQGHFIDVSQQAGIYTSAIGFGLGVSIGDLNGDTWPDIYVSNDFFERDYLYINQQDGTFKEMIEDAMPEISLNSMGADIADINNDGLPEVFVTDMLPQTDARYKTKTTFENWEKYQRNVLNGYHHQFIRNVLQLNRGGMRFSEIGRYAEVCATDWSWGALIFDMDMDGRKDIFVANGIYKDLTDQDYLNLYNDPETILGLMKTEKNVIKKLIDAIPSEKLANYAFHQDDHLIFSNKSEEWGLATLSFSNGSAYGDLDNDGDLDLVVNNTGMPAFVYKNNSVEQQSGNYLKFELKGISGNTKAIGTQIAVFAGAQKYYQEVQPMRGFESCVDPRPVFGLGKVSTVDSVKIIWPDGQWQMLYQLQTNRSISLDQKDAQLFASNPINYKFQPGLQTIDLKGLSFVHTENVYNDFETDRLMFNMLSREGPGLTVGDVNGDHLDDIFIGNAMNAPGALFIQRADGTFVQKLVPDIEADRGSEDTDAVFFDADGDHDLDLYVCSGGNEVSRNSSLLADRLYINTDGRGTFKKSSQILPTFNFESTSCVKPADFDQDGDLDLFVGVRSIPFNYGVPCNGYLLLNDGKGNFTKMDAPSLEKLGMITDAGWADIDEDGDQDLIVVGEWMPISIFRNDRTKFVDMTSQWGLDSTQGLWQTVTLVDVDDDGDPDIIGGNWGLNNRIKSHVSRPATLYINDFDQNGSAEQIMTTFNGDGAYPLTLRQDLIVQLPYLKKKYLRFESYRNQTIEDIFSPDQLKGCTKLVCRTTSTSLFKNEGGKMVSVDLPFECQLAPVFDILLTDIDHDGLKDILLGGNFSGVKPELGSYMANGLTLLQQTHSHDFIYSGKTNYQGEIRALRSIKVGKQTYILAANNDGPLRIMSTVHRSGL